MTAHSYGMKLSSFEEPAVRLFMAGSATFMIIHGVILQKTTIIVHTL